MFRVDKLKFSIFLKFVVRCYRNNLKTSVPKASISHLQIVFCGLIAILCFRNAELSADEDRLLVSPLGVPSITFPADNVLTTQKVALGRQLFFDPRLSSDDQTSCATCHNPQKGWSNGQALPKGRSGQLLSRGVPALVNAGFLPHYFWDGRVDTLEDAVVQPIIHHDEMNMPLDQAAEKLNQIEEYRSQFKNIFGSEATEAAIGKSLASFLRTLVAGDAPFDRFRAGDLGALSPAALRGHDVFFFRANCSACHRGPLLTDSTFQNLGIGMENEEPDLSRFLISHDDYDRGRFKTPTLRDVSRTAPYMHDGRFETLREVVDFYADGGIYNAHLSVQINSIPMTEEEKEDLVTFLNEALTSSTYPSVGSVSLPQ